MRTEKSILNVESNLFIYTFRSILSFIVRTVFIRVLGEKILGLDGLFTNILVMLSITDLGVSNAINFSLYKPLANKDYEKVSVLMSFYKKVYKIIGIAITIFGLILMLFLNKIVKEAPSNINIYIIYLIYLFDTVNLYFISYKETLIVADQNNYKLTKINFLCWLTIYSLQIFVLVYFKSFILYLLVKIVVLLIQRLVVNRFITNEYNYVNFKSKEKVNDKDLTTIKTNVRGMMFHKVGNFVVTGTDNIVISSFLNLALVGIYTNYLSLITMSNTLLSSSYKAITSSFGNLVATENNDLQEKIFRKISFAGHLLYSFVTIGFIVLINKFIVLWIGENYLLPISVVVIMCTNFYLDGMRLCIDSVKDASGTYDQDKYIPILQSIINIIVSIVLVKFIGIIGVVIGTLVSNILLPCWNRPYVIYKYVFKCSPKNYYIQYIKNIIINIFTTIIIIYILDKINLEINLVNFIISFVIYVVLYILITSLIYFRDENFKFYVDLLKKKIKKQI